MIQKILLLLVFVGLAGRGLGIMFGDLNRTGAAATALFCPCQYKTRYPPEH